ncbi:MAG TPA: hypothetical protein VIS95_01675 [Solirubrobacterales bacterium]
MSGKWKLPKHGKRAKQAAERAITYLLNHPVRLDAYLSTFEAMASPNEISKLLKEPLADVSFHMKELREEGAIELVKRAQRRGAVEHYYRASNPPEIDTEEWKATPKSIRRRIIALGLQIVIADALSSLRYGKLEDDENMYLVWMPMRLSREGQEEATALEAEMLDRMKSIKDRHEVPDTGPDGEPMKIAVMLWFERGVPGPRRPRDVPGFDKLA